MPSHDAFDGFGKTHSELTRDEQCVSRTLDEFHLILAVAFLRDERHANNVAPGKELEL